MVRRDGGAGIPAAGLLLALCSAAPVFPQTAVNAWTIDTAQSRVTIHVLPAGLFSSALHPHVFEPEEWSGEISLDPARAGAVKVEIRISAASLHDHQPKLSAKDVATVERRVQGSEVLDSARYPTILFEAADLEGAPPVSEPAADFRGTLVGTLTLHGRSRTLRLAIEGRLAGGRLEARGTATFRQTEFGIEPYRAALGTVAVRDEITVDISIAALPRPAADPAR